jgi:hypothetical protein
MLGANATMRMPSEPPTRPITIQGRRMPSRDVVRSLILPKNGFPTIANRAPVPVTTAKLLGACSIPTSEFTFNARVTSRGARNSRLLMNANVYSAMYPHPTRRAATDSPSSPAVEGSCGWALGCSARDRNHRALRSPKRYGASMWRTLR